MEILEEQSVICIRGSGVDMTKYAPSPLPPSSPVIFGVACRMLKIKGVEELITVFAKLISEGVPAKLLLAGDVDNGNPASLTKEFLIAAGHEGACEWRGFVDDMTGFGLSVM